MNLLDTGVVIEMIKERRFRQGIISPLTLIEILRGIENTRRSKVRTLLEDSFSVLNLDSEIIEAYCVCYSKLKEAGVLLPDADLLIAATAIAHELTLETRDKHFERMKSLGLELG
jgi:tRNA(fMet)-specific endonuclease VapC